jgi:hypothetical protein
LAKGESENCWEIRTISELASRTSQFLTNFSFDWVLTIALAQGSECSTKKKPRLHGEVSAIPGVMSIQPVLRQEKRKSRSSKTIRSLCGTRSAGSIDSGALCAGPDFSGARERSLEKKNPAKQAGSLVLPLLRLL